VVDRRQSCCIHLSGITERSWSSAAVRLISRSCSIHETSDYADLTILCGPKAFRVHKAILCPRSSFFTAACRHGKVSFSTSKRRTSKQVVKATSLTSNGQEALTNEINLPEDDPELIRLMIDYLYRLDYDHTNGKTSSRDVIELRPEPTSVRDREAQDDAPAMYQPEQFQLFRRRHIVEEENKRDKGRVSFDENLETNNPDWPRSPKTGLATHARMYALADKYQISGLKALAQRKFQKAALQHWNSEEFAPALHIVFTSTLEEDRGLRDVVISTISRDRLLEKPEVRAVVKELPELAFGLLMYIWKQAGSDSDIVM
jgi:hypothetical protein